MGDTKFTPGGIRFGPSTPDHSWNPPVVASVTAPAIVHATAREGELAVTEFLRRQVALLTRERNELLAALESVESWACGLPKGRKVSAQSVLEQVRSAIHRAEGGGG